MIGTLGVGVGPVIKTGFSLCRYKSSGSPLEQYLRDVYAEDFEIRRLYIH